MTFSVEHLLMHDGVGPSRRPRRAWICREEAESLFPALRGHRGTVRLTVSDRPFAERTSHRAELHLDELWLRVWAWTWSPRDVEVSVELCLEITRKVKDLERFRTCWIALEPA